MIYRLHVISFFS
uniref:Uncharacterized protein n=1 Tax=Anguilla anguilla TaxID=7936 RepID=A0A0E9XWL1_ANGAN